MRTHAVILGPHSYSTQQLEQAKGGTLPPIEQLVNYPMHLSPCKRLTLTLFCVMCGHECPRADSRKENKDAPRLILPRSKLVCTICRDVVWQMVESETVFKFCYECHQFLPWGTFWGEDKMRKSCTGCRMKSNKRNKRSYAEKRAKVPRKGGSLWKLGAADGDRVWKSLDSKIEYKWCTHCDQFIPLAVIRGEHAIPKALQAHLGCPTNDPLVCAL